MLYFPETKPKSWSLLEAIYIYDQALTGHTLLELLKLIKTDLLQFKEAQTSLKKHIDPTLESLEKLLNLNCHEKSPTATETNEPAHDAQTPTTNETPRSAQTPTTVTRNENDAPVQTSSEATTSSPLQNDTMPSIDNSFKIKTFSGNFMNGGGPVNVTYNKQKRGLDDITNTRPSDPNIILTEGQKKYRINTPDFKCNDIHRPKIRKVQLDSLEGFVHFGTSFTPIDPVTSNLYKSYEKEQNEKASLRNNKLFDYVVKLLMEDSESFLKQLWTTEPGDLTEKAHALFDIIRHTLTTFHLVLRSNSLLAHNHERTPFIENIIPSLLALSKVTGFVDFKWCETSFASTKELSLSDTDYTRNYAKYIDALGCLRTSNNTEIVIVESSSGIQKEHTVHTIEDTLKLLECGIASLKKEQLMNKNASIDTFKMLKVYTIHVIRNQVTLSEVFMNDEKSWCFVEKRTATIPTTWHDSLLLVEYLELISVLFDDLCDSPGILKQLMLENLQLEANQGPSIRSMFGE